MLFIGLFAELNLIEMRIRSVLLQQFKMRTGFHNRALIEDNNAVSIHNS